MTSALHFFVTLLAVHCCNGVPQHIYVPPHHPEPPCEPPIIFPPHPAYCPPEPPYCPPEPPYCPPEPCPPEPCDPVPPHPHFPPHGPHPPPPHHPPGPVPPLPHHGPEDIPDIPDGPPYYPHPGYPPYPPYPPHYPPYDHPPYDHPPYDHPPYDHPPYDHPPYPPHHPAPYVPVVPSVPPYEHPEIFPKEFSFGITSGAYHIEGAWDEDCASENIWDRWTHTHPEAIADGSNGDYAADAYNHIKEDIEILNNLTARHYRFSISWSRIIYDGCGEVNYAGIEHYKQLIHLLRLNQIEPIVTIYHGDLPQALQDQGGFLCEQIIDWYTEYARVLFDNFGDDVKYWITFNDPTSICEGGYGDGTFAPGISDGPGSNEYVCGHNLLKAHASVYHLYDDCYRHTQKGKISIALASDWYEPLSGCEADAYAAESKLEFQLGWWAHPIYVGDYPPLMIERIRIYNDCYEPRLPIFTPHEIEWIKDTHDFFSLNYNSAFYVSTAPDGYYVSVCYESDIGVEIYPCEGDFVTGGIRKLLVWIRDHYYTPAVFITSDGYGICSRDLNDDDRIAWIQGVLRNVRLAVIEDDCRVYGYSYYSYIDGFEWTSGYTLRFGLYDVEFDCPQKTRTARKSAAYFQHLATTGCIVDPCPYRH